MTIASLEARSSDELIPAFQKLAGRISGGGVNFVSVGQFFPYVIYSAALYDSYLRGLSEAAEECFGGLRGVRQNRYYSPDSWMPHVTLGKTLDRKQMRLAFEALQDNFIPFSGNVTEISLARVNPHRDVERFEL